MCNELFKIGHYSRTAAWWRNDVLKRRSKPGTELNDMPGLTAELGFGFCKVSVCCYFVFVRSRETLLPGTKDHRQDVNRSEFLAGEEGLGFPASGVHAQRASQGELPRALLIGLQVRLNQIR